MKLLLSLFSPLFKVMTTHERIFSTGKLSITEQDKEEELASYADPLPTHEYCFDPLRIQGKDRLSSSMAQRFFSHDDEGPSAEIRCLKV